MKLLLFPMLLISYQIPFLSAWMILTIVAVFCLMLALNRLIAKRTRRRLDRSSAVSELMQQALRVSNNNVVRYDIREGRISNLSGTFLPPGGATVEEWKQRVHPDDLEATLESFRRIINGEQERAEFFYRWRYDDGGKEPLWGFMHNTSIAEYQQKTRHVIGIVSTLWDEAELVRQEKEANSLTNKYKQIFEHSIIGLSFYTPDGWLVDANKIMRQICNFDSEEGDAFFSSVNLFDVAPFSEVLDRNNVEEFWACSLSVVPERNMCVYLEIRLHPIVDDEGKLLYLAIATRDISEERELYLQAKENDRQIQQANEAIRVYEEELHYMMETCGIQSWRISLDRDCIEFYSGLSTVENTFTLKQLQSIFVNQDDPFVKALDNPADVISQPLGYMGQMHPVVSNKYTEPQWVQINSIPEYDEEGRLKGSFGIWRNINHLMQKQEQLKQETERAQDSGRMKSVFLANMTHEIRTPLNAIVGFTDLLQSIDSPDDKKEMIRIIHTNCDMLLRLINDILALSSIDTSGITIVPAQVDFSKVFADTCESLKGRMVEPGVEFLIDNPYASLELVVDEGRMRQVMTNFLTNAVKYTHQGHIQLGYRLETRVENEEKKNGLYIYCEDTGDGIPTDVQHKIFDRFFKVNDYVQGTGLGLSICKAIADACHGQIGLKSKGNGCGSLFWIWVPVEVKEMRNENNEGNND